MTIMWALVRPFMSAKMKSRVRLLGKDFGAIAAEMDASQLPPCVPADYPCCVLACVRVLRMCVCVCVRGCREFGGTLEESPMAWFEEQLAEEAAGR
jgi:hypothetical protein